MCPQSFGQGCSETRFEGRSIPEQAKPFLEDHDQFLMRESTVDDTAELIRKRFGPTCAASCPCGTGVDAKALKEVRTRDVLEMRHESAYRTHADFLT